MTLPTDPVSPTVLYRDPQALARAQAVQYPPQGHPVTIEMRPTGYELRGEWHIGYLNLAVYERQQRPHLDTAPIWTHTQLQDFYDIYRNRQITVPGTVWPTAAVGMTTNLPTIRAAEGSRIHIWSVDANGYITSVWQGTQ